MRYLHAAQTPEGGWVGSWGICFTYAAQFALESLSLVGETYATSAVARRGCEFLLSHQRADGGWGESYKVRCSVFIVRGDVLTAFLSVCACVWCAVVRAERVGRT